jgi:RNA polymerase sigma factor (sigma-70 family)
LVLAPRPPGGSRPAAALRREDANRCLVALGSDTGNGHRERGRPDRFDGQFDAVLEGVRLGEPWAFERIFRALAPVITAYLGAQGSAEPDDLTSEVFLGVLRNIESFRGDEAGFRAWVFTIAHRRLTDERRRIGRHPSVEPLTAAADRLAPDDVEDAVVRSLGIQRLRTVCGLLGRDQRNVLLLRLVAGLTVEEVATALDKTPGAVKALQRRALRAIGPIVEREGARR